MSGDGGTRARGDFAINFSISAPINFDGVPTGSRLPPPRIVEVQRRVGERIVGAEASIGSDASPGGFGRVTGSIAGSRRIPRAVVTGGCEPALLVVVVLFPFVSGPLSSAHP